MMMMMMMMMITRGTMSAGPPRASAGPGADHFPGPSTSLLLSPPFPSHPFPFPPPPHPLLPPFSLPSRPFPSLPSYPIPSPLFPSLVPIPSASPSFLFPSLPSLPLEVGPLNPARGSGERCKLPQWGLGRSPSRN